MIKHWILDENENLVEVDLLTWAHYIEQPDNRCVDYTQINSQVWVSTIFLGIDHRFPGYPPGPPIVFETMVFGGPLDGEGTRSCSHDDAMTAHKMYVKRARQAAHQKVDSSC